MADEPEVIHPRSLVEQAADLRQMPGQDRMRAVALGIVATFPGIGDVLANVLANEVGAARERRLHDLLNKMATDIDRLRADLDDHLADDTFTETVETAIEEAMRASEEAKRAAYAAIVVNSLSPARPSEEERLFFLDVVGRSRTLHLNLLQVLLSVTEVAEGFYAGSARSVLLPLLPGMDTDLVGLAWNDLSRWGFLNPDWGGVGAMGTQQVSILSNYVTPLGRRFAGFVTVPA
jgi:ribosomal protein S13